MFTIEGKYGKASVYLSDKSELEEASVQQLNDLLNIPYAEGANIAIMPDVHAGVGCVIGYTQSIAGKVIPNLVGVDLNCGMLVRKIAKSFSFDFKTLDKLIRHEIPHGCSHRREPHPYADNVDFTGIFTPANEEYLKLSIGTLGGGNHFIEVDVDEKGDHYIVIHSGSRHLGVEICKYHQKQACIQRDERAKAEREKYIKFAQENHTAPDDQPLKIPDHLAWLEGEALDHYIHDVQIAEQFAHRNRRAMMDIICDALGIKRKHILDEFETLHNYVDTVDRVIRKGSIRLHDGERAIIPMNMRDGSLIVCGKGNTAANKSGPHGAGRLMSRTQARESLKMEDFKTSMKGIYTTSVSTETIDEAPMAYKPMDKILENLTELCTVETVIKPVYNFKAS